LLGRYCETLDENHLCTCTFVLEICLDLATAPKEDSQRFKSPNSYISDDMNILGISAFYHDSAAALIQDGVITFAAQEERFSRIKQDKRFPIRSIAALLDYSDLTIRDIDVISWYEDPDLKFRRSTKIVRDQWPKSTQAFGAVLSTRYTSKNEVVEEIQKVLNWKGKVEFHKHHESHMASALFAKQGSGLTLVVTVDGIGEFETGTAFLYDFLNPTVPPKKVWNLEYPNSIGLFYSAVTQLLGFEINEGEYKVMGLASYGKPIFLSKLIAGCLTPNSQRENPVFETGIINWGNPDVAFGERLLSIFDIYSIESLTFEKKADIAASAQGFLEYLTIGILQKLVEKHRPSSIRLAGGVALNCTSNSAISRSLSIPVDVQPAAGDAGGSIGTALLSAYQRGEISNQNLPHQYQVFLGAEVGSDFEINSFNESLRNKYRVGNADAETIAILLASDKVVGICRGRAEFGPRALGNRCILASPLKSEMKDHLNKAIKFREEFRPFAPVVRSEDYAEYFEELKGDSAHQMLFTVKSLKPTTIPAVTHIDGTSRVQNLSREYNPELWEIITCFYKQTGVPVLTLTSFNLKGEPIVQNFYDALKTFESSEIDALVIEDMIIYKR
jgi:carbamoyltransferase